MLVIEIKLNDQVKQKKNTIAERINEMDYSYEEKLRLT